MYNKKKKRRSRRKTKKDKERRISSLQVSVLERVVVSQHCALHNSSTTSQGEVGGLPELSLLLRCFAAIELVIIVPAARLSIFNFVRSSFTLKLRNASALSHRSQHCSLPCVTSEHSFSTCQASTQQHRQVILLRRC